MRLICVGDMHLGRRPSRLPDALRDLGIDPREITPARAWLDLIDEALRDPPRAVLLAGDVVDSANARFEAWGPLEKGVRRLTEAGVEVIAVAGNHDGEVLGELADSIPGFRLLGRGGRWEQHLLKNEAAEPPAVRIVGWSFSSSRCTVSPLAASPQLDPFDGPTLGLLHCDLNASESPYAPVQRRSLEELPVQAWLLGHQHQPSIEPGPRPLGYLGSLLGLDPGETGERGAWAIEIDRAGVDIDLRRLPSKLLRWERSRLDLSALDESAGPGEVVDEVRAEMRRVAEAVSAGSGPVRVLGLRCELAGKTPAWEAVARVAGEPLDQMQATTADGSTTVFLEQVSASAGPRLDLDAVAAREDLAAALARLLLELERGGATADALLHRMRRAVRDDAERQRLADGSVWDDAQLAQDARAMGEQLLDMLLEQVGEGGR